MSKYLIYILIILGLLFESAIAANRFKLKVGYLPILDHLTLLVSHSQDNCSFQKIEIQPKLFKSWNEMVGALKAEVINATFILSPLAIDLFSKGVPIKTILLAHRDGSAITIRKDSHIHSAADLNGKSIAIPNHQATHTALLNHYLRKEGLSLQDVITKVIAPPNMIKAMKLGKIDAFIVAEPFGAKAQSSGIGKILVLTKDIINHHVECIVVVNQKVLQKHPLAIQEWLNSLIKIGKLIDKDKLENNSQWVANITAKRYFSHSEETVILGLQHPSDRISFSDLNPKLEDFQAIMDISVSANIIKQIDLNKFIDARFYQNFLKMEANYNDLNMD
ncbi:MAG: ABC transporter substrate-binding protein [Thiomargarita sp.]|nr:ABC transporter substrate-binding protein [Thiomargarita sp.]